MLNPILLAHGLCNTEPVYAKRTTGFTAVHRFHYLCDTSAAAFTVLLPVNPKPGFRMQFSDYAFTFDTKPLTLDPQGKKIRRVVDTYILNTKGAVRTLVYLDDEHGWCVF